MYPEISPTHFFLSFLIATLSSILAYQNAKKHGLSPWFWACICFLASLPGLLMLWVTIYLKSYFSSDSKRSTGHPMSYNQEGRGRVIQEIPLSKEVIGQNPLLWYYVDETKKEKKGAFLLDELKGLYRQGVIHPQTFLWSKGMKNWEKLQSLPEIYRELKKQSTS